MTRLSIGKVPMRRIGLAVVLADNVTLTLLVTKPLQRGEPYRIGFLASS